MIATLTAVVGTTPDFDPMFDEFNLADEKIYFERGEGKWKLKSVIVHLEKITACYEHDINSDWTVVVLDGGVDFLIDMDVKSLSKVLLQVQSAAPFKKLHYIAQN